LGPQQITTSSLLSEMTDLERLTRLPHPAYLTRQFSSYDRRSTSPADHDAWFANDDWNQYIRTEERAGRKEYVMADVAGPGAVVRIWSADPKGVLRIYLDGNPEPVIEAPMRDLLGGTVSGLPRPIAGEYARGFNLYFPIPYAKHLLVTADKDDSFYHINYRTYPKNTPVQSFTPEDLARLRPAIDKVAQKLANPRNGWQPEDLGRTTLNATLSPGAEQTLAQLSGPLAVREFVCAIQAEDVPAAARAVVLEMRFDGQQTVACPLGDFFATAPGPASFASLPCGVTDEQPPRFWSHWWMPFGKEAVITVRNLGRQEVKLTGEIATAPYSWGEHSLLFHAKWRIERDIPTRPFTDWTHLDCTGNGRFVGGMLHVVNYARPWWGEGDEKIYVDGERFPSHIGTGSEDYYGYAWCSDEKFTHAYHNQTRCDGPWNYGDTSVNRFHLFDDIPFTRSFRFDMENWPSHEKSKTTRAAVSYWYARPGGKDTFRPITAADVEVIHAPPYRVLRVPGAQEAERLRVLSHIGGVVEPQPLGDQEEFSCEFQLWWHEARPGNKLVVEFNSDREAERQVIVGLTKSPDYAMVKLRVNDRDAGESDLYNDDGIKPSGPIDLGSFPLRQGANELTVEIVGKNPAAIANYMFGLDYVLVK
jgi:hypothetical protein